MKNRLQKIFPQIIARLTGRARHKVENLEWDKRLFSANLFRLWEMIFWRRCGKNGPTDTIRVEACTEAWIDSDGKKHIKRQFYTVESFVVFVEGTLRTFFKEAFIRSLKTLTLKRSSYFEVAPAYVYATMIILGFVFEFKTKTSGILFPMIGMAIALDSSSGSNTGAGTSLTYAHTCSGSNRNLWNGVFSDDSGDNMTGVTYNSSSLTLVDKQNNGNGTFPGYTYLSYIVAPSTGSNNVVVSVSGTRTIRSSSISYTGAAQSGLPDASTKGTVDVAATLTLTLTTIANNCWTVAIVGAYQNASPSTNFTQRGSGSARELTGDSNGAVTPAGSFSMNVNTSGNGYLRGVMASFGPFVASPSHRGFFVLAEKA